MVSYCFVISYLCVHILFISISVSKIFTSPRFMFTFVSRVSSVYICIYVHSIAKTGDGVSSQRPTSLQPPQGFQTVCCMSLQLFWAVSVPIINCLGISSRWRRRNSFFIAIDQRCDFTDCIWLGCFSEWAKREGRNQSHHHGQMIQEHQHVSKQHHQFFLSVNEYMYIYIYTAHNIERKNDTTCWSLESCNYDYLWSFTAWHPTSPTILLSHWPQATTLISLSITWNTLHNTISAPPRAIHHGQWNVW